MDLEFRNKFWGVPIVRIILNYVLEKENDLEVYEISLDTIKWYNYILGKFDSLYMIRLLDYACKFDKLDVIQWLKLDLNIEAYFIMFYNSLLRDAIDHNSSNVVEWIINSFDLVNEIDANSLLLDACFAGHLKCAYLLVNKFQIKEIRDRFSRNKISAKYFNEMIEELEQNNKMHIAQWLLETFGKQYTMRG